MSFMALKEELIRAFMVKVDAINDEAALRDLLSQLHAMPKTPANTEQANSPADKPVDETH